MSAQRPDVVAFLSYLREHCPELSMNLISGPFPSLEEDLSCGPDAVSIDGWWYVDHLEAAIRAATDAALAAESRLGNGS